MNVEVLRSEKMAKLPNCTSTQLHRCITMDYLIESVKYGLAMDVLECDIIRTFSVDFKERIVGRIVVLSYLHPPSLRNPGLHDNLHVFSNPKGCLVLLFGQDSN